MDIGFYLSVFWRRLPIFLIVATVISAAAVTAALTLPPAYESEAQIVVESPQIPEELAQSTVRASPVEQLQLLQSKLLTRENLLDIARRLQVLPNIGELNADQIVDAMRARTTIKQPRAGRNTLPLMTLTFQASEPRVAASVLNEYLTLIQAEDAEFRRGRSGETLEFFTQEVVRLDEELNQQGARILEYKQANSDALPDSLDFRMQQLTTLQERVSQIGRDITGLQDQRDRLVLIFEQTGGISENGTQAALSPDQRRLLSLQAELEEALVVYSPSNPRVTLLESRIAQLEARLAVSPQGANAAAEDQANAAQTTANVMLNVQLDEIDSQVAALQTQRSEAQAQIDTLNDTIQRTPEVTITLDDLERRYAAIEGELTAANNRLSAARTGDVIETRSRGQRISIIEQPAVPTEPTKPNRRLIAGGGTMLGIAAGLALIALLEILNKKVRRPEDLVMQLGVTPLSTIPYIRTKGEQVRQVTGKLILTGFIVTAVPTAVYAVHVYYLPIDLLADRVMDKIGVRW